ncbi:hypothetical protein [Treponema pedis]|uniref:hypothetical protein n=1 Tax=Treponema pedis TaxID=409322 RepID=UPI0004049756|nr:hypothetical protein [Treponema pedis]
MNWGIIYGVIGSIVGIGGGIIGTYLGIKNSAANEKNFAIKCAVFLWIGILVFIGLLFVLPKPYNFLLWIAYIILLPFITVFINKIGKRSAA